MITTVANIHKVLEEELEVMNVKLPTVNSGGCGVFALNLYRTLKKLGVNSCRILGDLTSDQKENILNIRNRNRRLPGNKTCSHVYLEVEGVIYDAEGAHRYLRDVTTLFEIKELELARLVASPRGWNKRFNRQIFIPTIKHLMRKFKKKYSNHFLVNDAKPIVKEEKEELEVIL